MAARARYYELAQIPDDDGFIRKVPNPTVTVYQAGTTTPIADTIYAAETGEDTLENPFTGGAHGEIEFFLEDAQRVSIKFEGVSPVAGEVTRDYQAVWPSPADILTDANVTTVIATKLPGIDSEDLGFVWDDDSSGAKADNAEAWANMAATVFASTATPGPVRLKAGTLHMNKPAAMNDGYGYGVPLHIEGVRNNTDIKLYGATTGPWLDFASGEGSLIKRGGLHNVRILHQTVTTSGPTIRLANVDNFELDGVELVNGGDGAAPLIAVQLIGSASGVYIDRSTLMTRTDLSTLVSGGLTAVSLDIATTATAAGLTVKSSQLAGVYGTGGSRGIRANNTALFDTMLILGCAIKDHEIGIATGSGSSGEFSNVRVSDTYIDITDYAIAIDPNGGSYGGWGFHNMWMRGDVRGVTLGTTNNGQVINWRFSGGEMIESATHGFLLQKGVTVVKIVGYSIVTNTDSSGEAGVELTTVSGVAPSFVVIDGNHIRCGNGADACIKASAAATFTIDNNTLVGSADGDGILTAGSLGATRKVGSNNTWVSA